MLYKCADADEYGQWVAVAGVTTFDTIRTQNLPRAEAARDGGRAQGIRIDSSRQQRSTTQTSCWLRP